jgi:hypothetical protein
MMVVALLFSALGRADDKKPRINAGSRYDIIP